MLNLLHVVDDGTDYYYWPDPLTGLYVMITPLQSNSGFYSRIYNADGEVVNTYNPSFGPTPEKALDLAIAKINAIAGNAAVLPFIN